MKTEPKQRGGARQGAGRKRISETGSEMYGINLPFDLKRRAVQAGADAIRAILDKHLPKYVETIE